MLLRWSFLAQAVVVPVGRRSGSRLATTLVATKNDICFFTFFFFFPVVYFSHKECSNQETYLAKVDKSAQKPRDKHPSRHRRPFWGLLVAILDFAGGERMPPAPLGWYFP